MYQVDSEATGVYPALIAAASELMQTKLVVVAFPWKRALKQVDNGETGGGGLYKTADRLSRWDFSDKLFEEVLVVYTRKGKAFPFNGVESLVGKRVGVIRGWSYGAEFDEAVSKGRITVEDVSSDGQNFAKLVGGRIDALIAVREAAGIAIASGGFEPKVMALAPPLLTSPTFIAFAKSAHKLDLIADFNRALATLHDNGSYDKIISGSLPQ